MEYYILWPYIYFTYYKLFHPTVNKEKKNLIVSINFKIETGADNQFNKIIKKNEFACV